ncbi:LRR receptor-like serine/threonine-protein kinase GHR1 [Camellia lanceoleosa]|uniref:LRR receptor-like serine/threonine-protein kinase GHR1 n=1 Tax=Camellia lanceoleosa TaxID=1840588 RepID=A0ACC0GM80_9ERIC|nr:LRR receptor-like serine/threonine-protein kinase GHR1 [Camellia lanceoleosa]
MGAGANIWELESVGFELQSTVRELPGFNFVYDLQVLKLSNNRFSGFVPNGLLKGDSLVLTELDLSGNNLSGPISMITSTTLNILNLSSNGLSGDLPLLTGSCAVVDLSRNQFGGNLSRLVKWANVEILDLSQNNLTGSIPEVTSQFLRLNYLNLSHNFLSSSLPKVVTQFPKLTVLDVSFNQLDGPFLTALLTSTTLQELHLENNFLSGSIEFSPSPFGTNLEVLDLSHNQLTGYFPDGFGSLTGLKVLSLAKNNLSGSLPTSMANLTLLSSLDISQNHFTGVANRRDSAGLVVSAKDLMTSRKGSSSEIISADEKITGFSPSKNSHFSWSPESGESYPAESLARLDVRSPDRLAGELHFLDDTITLSPEELSRAPAEVLGRSSHGTSYRATLDNGMFLTRKDFAKEAKKFANIRHPNVVGLRGYYWGPTQHEKLILSDYISPGSLASFLYDRPGRKGPPLSWAQRLKIAVDVARGLNYLHFDRAVPHGNIKATNILLDGPDLNARVADYCLHRLMTQAGTIEQILDAGVLGYRAPELASSKKPLPSFKSDVYAFGVILLELLTGKCAGDVVSGEDGGVDLSDWVRLKVTEGRGSECFDAVLLPEMGNPAADKGMKEVLGIALRCIRSVSERPGIKTIYEDLSSI